jgi:hypothetical protein
MPCHDDVWRSGDTAPCLSGYGAEEKKSQSPLEIEPHHPIVQPVAIQPVAIPTELSQPVFNILLQRFILQHSIVQVIMSNANRFCLSFSVLVSNSSFPYFVHSLAWCETVV